MTSRASTRGRAKGNSGLASRKPPAPVLTTFPAPSSGNRRMLAQYEKQYKLVRWEPPKTSVRDLGAAATQPVAHCFYGNAGDPNALGLAGDEEAVPASWMPNDKCLVCYECGVVFTLSLIHI